MLLTCVPEPEQPKVYPREQVGDLAFVRVLTGYVTEAMRDLAAPWRPSRPIDIGYRGSIQPLSFGRLGFEKRKIGIDVSRALGDRADLRLDITSAPRGPHQRPRLDRFPGGLESHARRGIGLQPVRFRRQRRTMVPRLRGGASGRRSPLASSSTGRPTPNICSASRAMSTTRRCRRGISRRPRRARCRSCTRAAIRTSSGRASITCRCGATWRISTRSSMRSPTSGAAARSPSGLSTRSCATRATATRPLRPRSIARSMRRWRAKAGAAARRGRGDANAPQGADPDRSADPEQDPRGDWVAASLARDHDVYEIGTYRPAVDGERPSLERVSDNRFRIRVERHRHGSWWLPEPGRPLAAVGRTTAASLRWRRWPMRRNRCCARRSARSMRCREDIANFRWIARYVLNSNSALLEAAQRSGRFDLVVATDLDTLPAGVVLQGGDRRRAAVRRA